MLGLNPESKPLGETKQQTMNVGQKTEEKKSGVMKGTTEEKLSENVGMGSGTKTFQTK